MMMSLKRLAYGFICILGVMMYGLLINWSDNFPDQKSSSAMFTARELTAASPWSVRHVFFLKTHKTASSTLQNIILRQAFFKNLTVALGSSINDYSRLCYNYNTLFKHSCAAEAEKVKAPFDIIAHHLRYNEMELKMVLYPDTKYISILRHPAKLIRSAHSYFEWPEKNVLDFVQNYSKYSDIVQKKTGLTYRNLMLFDFGLNLEEMNNLTRIFEMINHVAHRFDLVLIQEKFDESLVLLRHLFNWTVADIAYIDVNWQNYSVIPDLDEPTLFKINEYNHGDQLLYDFFYKLLIKKIDRFGQQRMKDEVKQLNIAKKYLRKSCSKKSKSNICELVTASELDLTQKLFVRFGMEQRITSKKTSKQKKVISKRSPKRSNTKQSSQKIKHK